MATLDHEKLARLKLISMQRIGGKGTPRRTMQKAQPVPPKEDKKLVAALKKLGTVNEQGVEEVNMFREDGKVVHFGAPKVQSARMSNTFAINGKSETKELTELVPGILSQLGPDSLNSLRKLTETYGAQGKGQAAEDEDEDEVPTLIEQFEQPE